MIWGTCEQGSLPIASQLGIQDPGWERCTPPGGTQTRLCHPPPENTLLPQVKGKKVGKIPHLEANFTLGVLWLPAHQKSTPPVLGFPPFPLRLRRYKHLPSRKMDHASCRDPKMQPAPATSGFAEYNVHLYLLQTTPS